MLYIELEHKKDFLVRVDMETAIKRAAHASWCKLGDEAALLDRSKGLYFKLNQSGTIIWEALREPISKSELVNTLVERCGISETLALHDVTNFLDNLKQLNLVEQELF